ncbi:MAG: hypothetical protein IJA72_02885 [Clostridia bacterium]|nr:hypothetical protein [Clostridia bacterium]
MSVVYVELVLATERTSCALFMSAVVLLHIAMPCTICCLLVPVMVHVISQSGVSGLVAMLCGVGVHDVKLNTSATQRSTVVSLLMLVHAGWVINKQKSNNIRRFISFSLFYY